jgi:hypothetical protein
MTTVLAFDPARHAYTHDGQEQVSVTGVLREAGLIEARWYTEDAAVRGTYVHEAIAMLHENDLDVSSLDPAIAPFVEAYQRFQAESGFQQQAWEQRVCDPALRCAGTVDLVGRFPDALGAGRVDLLDIKTGTVPTWVGYQTAGYAQLGWIQARRWCLQLTADATYKLHPLTGRRDRDVFLAALTVAQAKRGWL